MSDFFYQFFCIYKNTTKAIKFTTLITITICIEVFSNTASASCSVVGTTERNYFRYFPTSTIEVDSTAPMYSTLGEVVSLPAGTNAERSFLTCTTDNPAIAVSVLRPMHSPGIYESGVPGIGMKLKIGAINDGINSLPGTYNWTYPNGAEIFAYPPIYITLVKIGYIPSGGDIPTGPIISAHIPEHENFNILNAEFSMPITIKLLRPTCAVTTPNFTINLGDVSVPDFDSSGRTLVKNFSIDLTCTGGTRSADVHVTLTDANNPANATSQLGLSPDSTAEGIALEVNNRFGLVNFGPDLEGFGNPGQWNDGSTGIGSYSIPLSVNYVRLPGPIKGGSANSGVTYTLNYD